MMSTVSLANLVASAEVLHGGFMGGLHCIASFALDDLTHSTPRVFLLMPDSQLDIWSVRS